MTDRRTSTLRVGETAYTAYSERAAAEPEEDVEVRRQSTSYAASSAAPRLVRRHASPINFRPVPLTGGDPAHSARPSAMPAAQGSRLPAPTFSDRLVKSEARLVTAAVVCTAFVCLLLVVYLGAYARVTSLGIQQSQVTKALRMARQQNELLRAQVASAGSPKRIVPAAVAHGMEQPTGRVCYISSPAQTAMTHRAVGYQVASDGTNSKQYSTNFGH